MAVAPDLVEQVQAGKDPARVAGKEEQQVEFPGGEGEWRSPQADFPGHRVDAQLTGFQQAGLQPGDAPQGLHPAEQGLHQGVDLQD